ncbi:MAG: beta-galactosidase [Oscillospiraceae bacterium]|nr:beta-galactosidase [Oscillospiraceae bacterium]
MLHGGDYNPDQWLHCPDILTEDIALMRDANTNTFSLGIFAWAKLEPQEGVFDFAWLDTVINRIEAIGGNVILATPSGARPAWMSAKYPEVLRVNERREKQLHGARHNHCFSSPIYREKVQIINRKLAERYGDHKALLMWHISNEYGGDCHCNLCQENFRTWLKSKYQTLERLNRAWWADFWSHTLTDWNQIESPSSIGETGVHGLNLDWRRFVTDQTIDFYLEECRPFRELTPDVEITTNFMGEVMEPHPFAGLDYAKFAEVVDIVSWDAYPNWHNDYETTAHLASKLAFLNDYFRALKDKPFLIMESTPSLVNWHPVNKAKRPGMHLLSSIATLAHGSDSVLYFQWRKSRGSSEKFHGAVVDHDQSRENRVFQEVSELGRILENIKEIKGANTRAKVALLYDTENKWALDDAQAYVRADKQYAETLHMHYKYFWDNNIAVDVITKDKPLDRYQLVIAPMLYMMEAAVIEKLRSYVAHGGHLVSTYLTGKVDENDLVYQGGWPVPLSELFGVNVLETDTLYPKDRNSIAAFGSEFAAMDYCEIIQTAGAMPLGTYQADFYQETPAVTEHAFGRGRSYFIAARTGPDFLNAFYSFVYREESRGVEAEAGVSVAVREKDGVAYIFVMNFTESAQSIHLPERMLDIATGNTLEQGTHELPVYGFHVLKRAKKEA